MQFFLATGSPGVRLFQTSAASPRPGGGQIRKTAKTGVYDDDDSRYRVHCTRTLYTDPVHRRKDVFAAPAVVYCFCEASCSCLSPSFELHQDTHQVLSVCLRDSQVDRSGVRCKQPRDDFTAHMRRAIPLLDGQACSQNGRAYHQQGLL